MKKGKVYIAGQVTDLNYREVYQTFKEKEKELALQGWEVINPLELVPANSSWENAMKLCINELLTCQAIYLLKGWHKSRGAKLETRIAFELDMQFLNQKDIDNNLLIISPFGISYEL